VAFVLAVGARQPAGDRGDERRQFGDQLVPPFDFAGRTMAGEAFPKPLVDLLCLRWAADRHKESLDSADLRRQSTALLRVPYARTVLDDDNQPRFLFAVRVQEDVGHRTGRRAIVAGTRFHVATGAVQVWGVK